MFRYRLGAYFRHKRGALLLMWLLMLALAALLLLAAADRFLGQVLDNYIDIKLQAMVSRAVNEAVLAQFQADTGFYTGLVTIQRDTVGAITAIDTDTVRVNLLKARVAQATLEALERAEYRSLEVPMGTLLGSNLLLGRGPAVSVRLVPAGAANTVVVSQFESAGINQTCHRLTLEVQVAITVIRPGATISEVYGQQVLLGETVIVGSVPDSYTYIDDTRDGTLDKILDYSGQNSP